MFKFIRFRGSANQVTIDNRFIPVVVIASGRWDYLISLWWNAVTEDHSGVPARMSKKTEGVSEETWRKYCSSILLTNVHFLWFLYFYIISLIKEKWKLNQSLVWILSYYSWLFVILTQLRTVVLTTVLIYTIFS